MTQVDELPSYVDSVIGGLYVCPKVHILHIRKGNAKVAYMGILN